METRDAYVGLRWDWERVVFVWPLQHHGEIYVRFVGWFTSRIYVCGIDGCVNILSFTPPGFRIHGLPASCMHAVSGRESSWGHRWIEFHVRERVGVMWAGCVNYTQFGLYGTGYKGLKHCSVRFYAYLSVWSNWDSIKIFTVPLKSY